jgi:hypothetical protein
VLSTHPLQGSAHGTELLAIHRSEIHILERTPCAVLRKRGGQASTVTCAANVHIENGNGCQWMQWMCKEHAHAARTADFQACATAISALAEECKVVGGC